MKNLMKALSIFLMLSVASGLMPALGQEKNLDVNKAVTAKIRAFDKGFFKGFDVYQSGVKEAPTVLLFDIKDEYPLPGRNWAAPLSEEEIMSALYNLEHQYYDCKCMPFPPRALNIVNLKGKVLGYVYTGVNTVLMDRKKDGSVTVFLPPQLPRFPINR